MIRISTKFRKKFWEPPKQITPKVSKPLQLIAHAADISSDTSTRDHPYIMSPHFWTFSDPPTLRKNNTERQQKLPFFRSHSPSHFADVIRDGPLALSEHSKGFFLACSNKEQGFDTRPESTSLKKDKKIELAAISISWPAVTRLESIGKEQ